MNEINKLLSSLNLKPLKYQKIDNIYIVDDDFLFDEDRLKKFISLLKERALYLARIDQFSDPFECAIGLAEHTAQKLPPL